MDAQDKLKLSSHSKHAAVARDSSGRSSGLQEVEADGQKDGGVTFRAVAFAKGRAEFGCDVRLREGAKRNQTRMPPNALYDVLCVVHSLADIASRAAAIQARQTITATQRRAGTINYVPPNLADDENLRPAPSPASSKPIPSSSPPPLAPFHGDSLASSSSKTVVPDDVPIIEDVSATRSKPMRASWNAPRKSIAIEPTPSYPPELPLDDPPLQSAPPPSFIPLMTAEVNHLFPYVKPISSDGFVSPQSLSPPPKYPPLK